MLETADKVYERLVDQRHQLDGLLSTVSSGSRAQSTSHPFPTSSGGRYYRSHMFPGSGDSHSQTSIEGMVNKSIQVLYVHVRMYVHVPFVHALGNPVSHAWLGLGSVPFQYPVYSNIQHFGANWDFVFPYLFALSSTCTYILYCM